MIYIEEIEKVRDKFSDLGREISEVSSLTEEWEGTLISSLRDGLSSFLTNILSSEEFGKISSLTSVTSDYLITLEKTMKEKSSVIEMSFKDITNESSGVKKSLEDITEKLSGFVTEKKEEPVKEEQAPPVEDKGVSKKPSDKPGMMATEMKNLKGKLSGMLSKLKLPKPGHFLAGGLMLLAYGFTEKDRMRAQAGEVKNIIVGAFDDGVKGMVSKGTSSLAGLQESLQRFMGISREEVQGVASAFVGGGFSVNEMLQKVDGSMGRVGKNFVTYSLGLDKMFEMAGGESARKMVQLMTDYGKSAEEAKNSYTKLMFAGKESGIGTIQFVKNIETATESLKMFGFDIDNVIDLAASLQKHFEEMGVPRQFAGRQAALGLQQIARGLTSMSDSWKVMLGEQMGLGTGLEARQKVMESWLRMGKGEMSKEEQLNFIGAAFSVAMRAGAGDESKARYILESSMGLGFEGARAVMMIGKNLKEGKIAEASQNMERNTGILRRSFQTEAEKTSRIERLFNRYLKGMSEIGMGILGIVSNILAALIAFLGSLPIFFENLFKKGSAEKNAALFAKLGDFFNELKNDANNNLRKIIKGGRKAGGALAEMGSDIFPSLNKAFSFFTDRPAPGGYSFTPTTVQIVTVPVAGEGAASGTYEFPEMSMGEDFGRGDWVGGGLAIECESIAENGDMTLTLVGNCPRCGLVFGEEGGLSAPGFMAVGEHDARDVEALARVIQREIGGYTGRNERMAALTGAALINQAKSRGKGLYEAATEGKGWGKQGEGKRRFGTVTVPTEQTTEFAKKLLTGEVEDPSGGKVQSFIHISPGTEFRRKGYRGALPPAVGKHKIIETIPMSKGKEAIFFGGPGVAGESAAGKQTRAKYESTLAERKERGIEPVEIGKGTWMYPERPKGMSEKEIRARMERRPGGQAPPE